MARAAFLTTGEGRPALRERSPWLRLLLFWGLIAGAVGAALISGAASREAAWELIQAERVATSGAARVAGLERQLAATGAELADTRAALVSLEIAGAAAADPAPHLRLDRGAGALELVWGGAVLRRVPAEESPLAAGSYPLALGVALPIAPEDALAIEGLLAGGGTLYVY